jgi:hypothetical protein|tara:strand:+ start:363 stop:1067 length:705 start_codon:yes stop_codon:yes gene_type:complete
MQLIQSDENTAKVLDDRFYWLDERWLPSVTTILSVYPKGNHLLKWVGEHGLLESNRLKNLAAEKGSIVHHACEFLLNKQELEMKHYEMDEWRAIMAFVNFCKDHSFEVVETEKQTESLTHGYAGTLDAHGFITGKEGKKRVRCDWKTSNHAYIEHDLQLVTYEMAEREKGNPPADELWVVYLGKSTKSGYSLHKIKPERWEDHFETFKICKALWDRTNPNAKPFEKELPLTIKL